MTDVAAACAELATLAPLLTPALRRDRRDSGRYSRLEPLSLFNTDVLLARNRLVYEIPAAAIRSAHLVHETWPWRPIGTCLRVLPVYASRMEALNMATEHRQLEMLTRAWVLQTKRALGLRRPDVGPLADCPRCDTHPPGQLWMAGAEASLNPRDLTAPPHWVHDPRVYCPLCGASWPEPEWDHLARLVTVREMA